MTGRADHLVAIGAGRDALVAAARSAGLAAAVPSARRWRVRDLLVHTGNVHDWAASVLRSRVEQPQAFDAEPADVGSDLEDLLGWYAERADALLDLLGGGQVPDDTPVWTFGPDGVAATAAFWSRRQAHEITMHAVDGQLAAGRPVAEAVLGLDPALSADGADEVLTVMLPRVAHVVPRPALPGRLALVAADTGHRWVLERDGRIRSDATDPVVSATLVGPAAALFALLWRRAFLDIDGSDLGIAVEGDRAVVDALFAARLTP